MNICAGCLQNPDDRMRSGNDLAVLIARKQPDVTAQLFGDGGEVGHGLEGNFVVKIRRRQWGELDRLRWGAG